MVLPRWSRLLHRTGRALHRLQRAELAVRSELLLAFLSEEQRREFTFVTYEGASAYLPGGTTFEAGLAPWEARLLEHDEVPREGRVLLAGAGGGRELRALSQRGYSVFAFEPVETLCSGARRVALEFPRSSCIRAAYSDLVLAREGLGPLAGAPAPFDLVYLGWGSFTHLMHASDRAAVLRAARTLSPQAPLIVSFWMRWATADSRSERLRGRVRRLLSFVRGTEPPVGLEFDSSAGFGHCFEREEFEELAAQAGYRVALFDSETFPHALLVPLAAESSR